MKKVLLTLAAVAVSVSVMAQGTVNFQNIGGAPVTYEDGGAPIGATASDGIITALYWAPAGTTDDGAMEQIGAAANFLGNGFFLGGTRTAPVTPPGASAAFQVRAWDSNTGATYEEALASGLTQAGKSAIFESATGNPEAIPPGLPVNLAQAIPAFTVATVPEPSAIALGMLGVGALFLVRRRK